MRDYFAFFGVDRSLTLDAQDLERRFYRLSRQLHPDRHARATPAEQQKALEASAILNDAYRTLRDPVARAEHLLALHGIAPGALRTPPELAEEFFELNEALEQGEDVGPRIERLLADCDARLAGTSELHALRALLDLRHYLARLGDRRDVP